MILKSILDSVAFYGLEIVLGGSQTARDNLDREFDLSQKKVLMVTTILI